MEENEVKELLDFLKTLNIEQKEMLKIILKNEKYENKKMSI